MIWKPWGEHPKGMPVLAGWRYPDMWRFAVAMEETGRRAGRVYAGLSDVTDEPPDVFAEIALPGAEPTPGPYHQNGFCLGVVIAIHDGPDAHGNHYVDGRHQHTVATCERVEDAAHIVRALNAHEPMLEILKTTAGNIRSLGPAGRLASDYEVWLAEVEAAIAKAEA